MQLLHGRWHLLLDVMYILHGRPVLDKLELVNTAAGSVSDAGSVFAV